jgi:predicted Fe-S protein YdhL (DUF1289 family)
MDSESPCVRNCCLDDQDICLGCGRHLHEITGWSKADEAQRRAILALSRQRLLERRQQFQSGFQDVENPDANKWR